MKHKHFLFFTLVLCGLLTGCTSTKVERVDREEMIDLSGSWNDYDAMLVSDELIEDCLSGLWLNSFVQASGRNPVVIVGHIKNLSHDHINAQIFTKQLERALINSGKVVFVASQDERGQIREERDDHQAGYTLEESIKEHGRERGADIILMGSINSVKDEVKGKYTILYQVNLELIDLVSNQKLWIGQKEIKKSVKKSSFSL